MRSITKKKTAVKVVYATEMDMSERDSIIKALCDELESARNQLNQVLLSHNKYVAELKKD